jgi:hypothetical protein
VGECNRRLEEKLRNYGLHGARSSSNIIRKIIVRIVRLSGHVARMGKRERHTRFWWGT